MLALENINWTVIGLSEVRRYGEEIEEHENFIFYYKGETPGKHGVGFLIHKTLKDEIEEIIGISERIAILNMTFGREKWSIVQIYSPTEQSSHFEIDLFYKQLAKALKENTHENKIVMGDFNARIGERRTGEDIILGPYCYGKRTRNGEKLIELAYEYNLKILNTQYRNRNRWTWTSPNGLHHNEIDYILTNKSKEFQDCRTLKGLNFNSNHRMIRAKLSVQHLNKKRHFKAAPSRESEYNIEELAKRLKTYTENSGKSHLQEKYNKLEVILKITTRRKKDEKHNKIKSILSDKTFNLLKERADLINTKPKTKTIRKDIACLSKLIKESIRKDRDTHRLKTFEHHIAKTGGTKKALRLLTEKREWIPKLNNKIGRSMTRRPDILETATEFYRNLFTSKNEYTETDLSGDEEAVPKILTREVEKAIETQKREKAPGPDNIQNDLLLLGKEELAGTLTKIFNEVIESEYIPKQWLQTTITLLHKKGDKNDIGNYRPISLMSNLYKVFAKVILGRLTKTLDENQPKEQAGFRRGYSTIDHIHVVKQVIEKCKEYNIPFYCCFIDYSKAFDSLEHEAIWCALKNQGVGKRYIRIIKNIYKNSTTRLKLEKQGQQIKIGRGVRQGDPLSPKLFSAVLEEVFRQMEWENYGLNINGEKLTHLRFADDLIIFSNTSMELTKMLQDLDNKSQTVGLCMNKLKTKAMTNSSRETLIVNGSEIEYVQEYTYLGQVISPKDLTTKEMEIRIGNAWKRYWTYKEIMKSKEMSVNIKRKLYNTCILPVLTYGCQTWALTKEHYRKLEVCQRSMERSMLNKKKLDKIRNTTIRKITKLENISYTVRKNKWRWTGHTMRGAEKWSKIVTNWYPTYKKRNRGRQFKRWEDEIKSFAGPLWSRTTEDREQWRKLEEAYAKWQTE